MISSQATKLITLDILRHLEFNGMNKRYEDSADRHRETFEWIYEDHRLKLVPWLENGRGVYWITGKAGSGKSTLMKFLFEDSSCTIENSTEWRTNQFYVG